MHLDPYIIFADSNNCNYLWVTGSLEIRSDFPIMYPANSNEWALYDQAMIDEGFTFVLTTAVDKYGDPLYVYYINNGIKFLCDLETYKPYRMQFSDGTYHEVLKN